MANKNFTLKDSAISLAAYGRKLAVDMLTEVRAIGADATSIEPRFRSGAPQSDILTRYLRFVNDQRNTAIEAGFFAVLTDHLGSVDYGVVDDPEFYNDLDENGNERGFALGVSAILPKGRATTTERHAGGDVIPLHGQTD